MPHTDPISDMITRINNAQKAGHKSTAIPASRTKQRILEIMNQNGYLGQIRSLKNAGKMFFDVEIKYDDLGKPKIREIKRISKPGLRIYRPYKEIPRIKRGIGTVIISTSKGYMTDREARENKIGGELVLSLF